MWPEGPTMADPLSTEQVTYTLPNTRGVPKRLSKLSIK